MVERAGASGTLQIRIGSWRSPALRNVPNLIEEARTHLDGLQARAVQKTLSSLDQWAEAARPEQLNEARQCAARVRDEARRQTLIAEIDVAAASLQASDPLTRGQIGLGTAVEAPPPTIDPLAAGQPDPPIDLVARASRAGLNIWANRLEGEVGYTSANTTGAANYQNHPTLDALIAAIEQREARQATARQATPRPDAPPDMLKEQARDRITQLFRTGFALWKSETVLLQILALSVGDRDQRGQVAEMRRDELEDLLIGRIVGGALSGDVQPLLTLLNLDPRTEAPEHPGPQPSVPSTQQADVADPLAALRARVTELTAWLERANLAPADLSATDEAGEIVDLDDTLEAYLTVPDVQDEDYDALSAQIGELQRTLRARLTAEDVVAG